MSTMKKISMGVVLATLAATSAMAKPGNGNGNDNGGGSAPAGLTAQSSCASNGISGTGVTVLGCLGGYTGNLNNGADFSSVKALLSSQWTDETFGSGIIKQVNSGAQGSFLQGLSGHVVVGIHWGGGAGGGQTSFYHLNLSNAFNGTFQVLQSNPGGFSNIALYAGQATAPVPEPETYALMLAGLGAVGFVARRRRSA